MTLSVLMEVRAALPINSLFPLPEGLVKMATTPEVRKSKKAAPIHRPASLSLGLPAFEIFFEIPCQSSSRTGPS